MPRPCGLALGKGVRWEEVPGQKGAFGLRGRAWDTRGLFHKGWGEDVGERTGARVFVLPRPPGWTCS